MCDMKVLRICTWMRCHLSLLSKQLSWCDESFTAQRTVGQNSQKSRLVCILQHETVCRRTSWYVLEHTKSFSGILNRIVLVVLKGRDILLLDIWQKSATAFTTSHAVLVTSFSRGMKRQKFRKLGTEKRIWVVLNRSSYNTLDYRFSLSILSGITEG